MLLLLLVFDHVRNGTGKTREVLVTYSSSRQTVDTLRIVHEHLNSDSYRKKEIVQYMYFQGASNDFLDKARHFCA